MKIKRFVAPDMRQAMRAVREDQGPDAVILSTRRMDDGIEIIAAVDFDEALVREAARHGAPLEVERARPVTQSADPIPEMKPVAARRSDVTPPPLPTANRRDDDGVTVSLSRRAAAPRVEPVIEVPAARAIASPAAPVARGTEPKPVVAEPTPPVQPNAASDVPASIHPMLERAMQDTARVRAELGSLRELLETQLSSLIWNDMERRQPMRARILREMTRLGIEPDVARQLVGELPVEINAEQARYLPLGVLSRSLSISPRDHADRRSVTALVGSTGVGKTTTIAMLAARAVMRHGASQVALVSTDHYRIGAAAQLEHYGRLLGVRVYPAYDADSLRQVLELLRGYHTVLVDTAGLAGGDPRLAEQLDVLRNGGDLRARCRDASSHRAVDGHQPGRHVGRHFPRPGAPPVAGALAGSGAEPDLPDSRQRRPATPGQARDPRTGPGRTTLAGASGAVVYQRPERRGPAPATYPGQRRPVPDHHAQHL